MEDTLEETLDGEEGFNELELYDAPDGLSIWEGRFGGQRDRAAASAG